MRILTARVNQLLFICKMNSLPLSMRCLYSTYPNLQIADMIRGETQLTCDSLTPEIKLHLITSSCRLWNSTMDTCPFLDPYWAFYWPGGQALTRYLLDHPTASRNRRVFDLGSGCGASAIACALNGATRVIANDTCPVACTAIEMNAAVNKVSLEIDNRDNITGQFNWCGVDVLLVGDMFYDSDFALKLTALILEAHMRGVKIYVGDPGRISLVSSAFRKFLVEVASYKLPDNKWMKNNGFPTGHVWTLGSNFT